MKIKVNIDTQTFQVEIDDIYARPVIALVDGERYEVWPEDEGAEIFQNGGKTPEISYLETSSVPATGKPSAQGSSKDVISPLPGVVVAILVKPGDSVEHGQELFTLEAMKMKNAIRSNREGMIASIDIDVGDQVNHGQVLMSFEG
jgi:biotin carboxyl carrier protein